VGALADSLQHDTDLSVRELAARAIIKLGPSARHAAGTLIAVLKETEPSRTRPAQGTINGRDVASLRPSVAEALGAIGAADEAVSILTAALTSDPSSSVRRGAAQSLGSIHSRSPAVISVLNVALEDKDVLVRIAAAESLHRIDPQNAKSIPVLIGELKESGWPAATAIERLGATAKEAVPALIAAAKNNGSASRQAVFQALGSIGPDAKDAVPVLISELKRPLSELDSNVGERLTMGNQPPLDFQALLRVSAARALWQVTHSAELTLRALVELSNNKNQVVRKSVAEGLGQMGAAAGSALPVLRELLEDDDLDVREAAATALRQIDPNAPNPPN
jgi:HEAT repeat protein